MTSAAQIGRNARAAADVSNCLRILEEASVVLDGVDRDQATRERLRALGSAPVDPALSRRTIDAMRSSRASAQRRRRWFAIGGATLAGFVAGSIGVASAGALPAGMQDVAQSALAHVGVHVPPGHERYNDPAVCPGGPYQNHGEYVRSHKDDPNAGSSPCGKPVKGVNGSIGSDKPAESEREDTKPEPKAKSKGADKTRDENDESDSSTPPTPTPPATSAPDATTTTQSVAPATTPSTTSSPSSASS